MNSDNRENHSLLTIVKAQLVFLLSTLTEDNFDRNQLEIRSLSEQHGVETYLHFIRRLIAASQSRLASTATPSAFDPSTSLTFRLLVQETQRLARDPFLADRFRDGIDKGEGDLFRHFDLVRFADRVGLRPLERLVLAASIVSAPTRKELSQQAMSIIRVDFDNAVLALCNHPSFDHADLSPSQVSKLMSCLLSDPPTEQPILDPNQRLALIMAAQQKYGPETIAPILRQIFPTLSLSPGATLVQTLLELGPEITSDADTVRALLGRFGMTDTTPPREAKVVELVSGLARAASEGQQLCDAAALMRALSSFRAPLHWASVIRVFDRPERQHVDTATLKLIIPILTNTPRDTDSTAVSGFWSTWTNPLYQLRLLDALLSLPSDTFNFVSLPGRRVVTVEDVAAASPTIKALAANVQGHTWNSLDLFETLVRLGDHENADVKLCVREMLDKSVKISAELVHMGLLQVPKPWNTTQSEYAAKLLAMFLAGHPNHQLVFMRIWQIDPNYLTGAFREFYNESALNITRILDVAQDLKILDSLLDVRPFQFALDVAALASRREYLNLDKWLADNINTHKEDFIRALMDFLDTKVKHDQARVLDSALEQRTMSLNAQTIAIFIRVMRNYIHSPAGQTLPKADQEYMIEIRNACLQLHPRLMNLAPGAEQEPGMSVVSFPQDVETEVEGIYKRMYEESISIDQVIHLLQRAKASTNPRDHEIFACTLHSLFDEYKFFQSHYPIRELLMTGYLFGSIIQFGLVDYIPLGIAIRYVLDALKEPRTSNMFKFGIEALSRFESRLPEWQPLCQALLTLPDLQAARPDLAESARRALIAIQDGEQPNGTADGRQQGEVQAFTALRPDPIGDEEFEVPDEEVSDKILFIVNNLARNNFDTKAQDMRERFSDNYARWFANYLVDQRVATEPNNHELYIDFLDALVAPQAHDSPSSSQARPSTLPSSPLGKFVLHETLIKSAALLNSEKTLTSSSERAILKNIGSWLGWVTVRRNRPIKHKNLAFKELLLEGFDNNRLIVAIPFVCKVLEHCAASKVFRPPNPWLMAVISVLAELYHFADLKLNLIFEIEMLCKSLDVDLDKVEPTTVLRNRPQQQPAQQAIEGAPAAAEFAPDAEGMAYGQMAFPSDQQGLTLGRATPTEQRAVTVEIEDILTDLANSAVISPQLAPFNANINFKRAVILAIDRTVREIILPVIERSVTIAGISTRELVAKDFALEGNEEKMRKAAHLMAQKLAGSLALVTCKEPLKSNMITHIRQSLADQGFHEHVISDQAIGLLVNDNLENACAAIETAAMDRAVAEVDEAFAAAYENRRRHRELRPGHPFWEQHLSPFAANLPEPLRLRPNGLSYPQTRLYEDFAFGLKRRAPSRIAVANPYPRNGSVPPPQFPPVAATHDLQENTFVSHAQCLERFTQIVPELERMIDQATAQSIAVLPPNHEIRVLARQVLFLANQSAEREETALAFSQKVVQLLYKVTSNLGREIFVVLLDGLCQSSAKVAKEAIEWLLYSEDERKFSVPVIVALLRGSVITFSDQDVQLAKWILRDFRITVIDFTAKLIKECLFGENPCATRNQFQFSLEALARACQIGSGTKDARSLLDQLNSSNDRPSSAVPPEAKLDGAMYDKLAFYFSEWVRMFQGSVSTEKSFYQFVQQLSSQGILKGEEISSLFFRVCAETSVDSYAKFIATNDFTNAFKPIDALSRLIALLVKFHGDDKVRYMSKSVAIVVLVLAHAHEASGLDFQQKPFFRFFSSLLSDLHSIETHLGATYFRILQALCDNFNTLQPLYFPGFAFSWMSLISHRLFMPKLLLHQNREGWPYFHKLVIALFRFLSSFLQAADLQNAARNLYRGALRLLLVLLHDFPDFLSEYYFTICDVIPSRCIQLRNIVLSAYPVNLELPDPHLRNLKFDTLPDMGPIPPILSDFTANLKNGELRGSLEQILLNRGSPALRSAIKEKLFVTDGSEGATERYNLAALNAVVMYIGVSSVAQAKARSGAPVFVASDPGVVLMQHLASTLDAEGQHHLLGSMVMHLRYPNAHTHWFGSLILFLFQESKDDQFREILTKVLLERFIVHRPHPWGALITFIQLLRNPKYDFWNQEFIRVAPEITMLLDGVARSVL